MAAPSYAIVDLNVYGKNIANIRKALKPGTRIMALVKADAYGHGMEAVAKRCESIGVEYLAVATAEEGERLRKAGVNVPVLALNAETEENMLLAVRCGVASTVFSYKSVMSLNWAAEEAQMPAVAHIQVDTGLGRVGVRDFSELRAILTLFKNNPDKLKLEGIYTHFSESDAKDKSYSHYQLSRFSEAIGIAREMGFNPLIHASNSGGILDLRDADFDMVRPGILSYGYYPSKFTSRDIQVSPVLQWKTSVVQVKTIEAGQPVSYDRTFVAKRETVLAVLPVGYGDGYKRLLSNRGCVLIRGKRAPVVGRVCMDLTMADVTDIPGVCEGDEVVLIGKMGDEAIWADEMAEWAETISYETLLSISARVPRVYV